MAIRPTHMKRFPAVVTLHYIKILVSKEQQHQLLNYLDRNPLTPLVMKIGILSLFVAMAAAQTAYNQEPAAYKSSEYTAQAYSFDWEVNDAPSYNNYGHSEKSDGNVVTGSYRVLLPDGRTQIVTYKADSYGYVADVKYEGEAKYPEYKPAPYSALPAYKAPAAPAPSYSAPTTSAPAPVYKAQPVPVVAVPAKKSPAVQGYQAPATTPPYKVPASNAPEASIYQSKPVPAVAVPVNKTPVSPAYKLPAAATVPAPYKTNSPAYKAPVPAAYRVPATPVYNKTPVSSWTPIPGKY